MTDQQLLEKIKSKGYKNYQDYIRLNSEFLTLQEKRLAHSFGLLSEVSQ